MQKIKVVGKTNPFFIKLVSVENPFQIDNFYEIIDSENDNPICRIIKSENLSIETLKNTEREIYPDVENYFQNSNTIYLATAKIENYIKKPIKSGADVSFPSFEKIKPFLVKQEISDSFILGEINGTNIFMNTVPDEYKNLFMVRKNNSMLNQTSVPLLFDYKKMSEAPHIGLFGGSGSGKTFALKVIAEEMMHKNIPTILFDPHLEMNFATPRNEIPASLQKDFSKKFKIFTIGNNVGIDFSELSTDELIRIIGFSGELSGPMENLLRELHHKGDTYLVLIDKIKKLTDFKSQLEQGFLDEKALTKDEKDLWDKYKGIIPTSNTLIGISWRINSINSTGIFNKDITDLKNALSRRQTCVLRGEMKSLNIVGSYLISKLYFLRKEYIDGKDVGIIKENFLPFVIAMDEAHIFCPKTESKSPIKTILRTIAQEGRKYGVFEVMATQRPSLLDETVVAQMSTKFIFKLSIKEDLASVQKETDLSSEEIERLPYINSGECFISSSIYGKTMSALIRYNVTDVKSKSNPFDELTEIKQTAIQKALIRCLPIDAVKIDEVVDKIKAMLGKTYKPSDLIEELEQMVDNNTIYKKNGVLGNKYFES